ncbi:unnamed protein product [Gongylonema pulchrum]|uniref:sn-1-specific diacylglycerol lipase n=1 Tax=Gongylonema pulchrum TaxID=637853 RepID=A0A183DPA2_9BILA|nr:unnamed protein product [Gongylonema pulchrum]
MLCDSLFQVPFIVLEDAKSKSIVITIRGTASMMDAVNDLSLDDEAFSVDVDQDPILRRDEKLDAPDKGLKMKHPEYTIVVCGHSLGAGVATLLTLLLKQTFPSIRCYAFCPPGCVISENGLKETEKYVFSVFIGDDIVPRLSFQVYFKLLSETFLENATLCKLKYDVIKSLALTNSPKYKVLLRGFYRLCFSSPWEPGRGKHIFALEPAEESVVVNINDRIPLVFHNPLMIYDDNGADAAAATGEQAERWASRRIKVCFSSIFCISMYFSLRLVKSHTMASWYGNEYIRSKDGQEKKEDGC